MTTAQVQHTLNVLGATPPLKEDNINGPLTTAAVKAFQSAMGIQVDGIVGPQTMAAFQKALGSAQVPQAAVDALQAYQALNTIANLGDGSTTATTGNLANYRRPAYAKTKWGYRKIG
jgi:peptidoglycan hydrolase-like protein with peptidoglycan-binding domain